MRKIVFESDEDGEPATTSQTTAEEWRALRSALSEHLRALQAERDKTLDAAAQAKLDARIEEARRQIQALAIEEGVARFTEDSERYVLATGAVREELSRDPDTEIA